MGRRKLPDGEKLSRICHVRLEPEMVDEMTIAADEVGCNVSDVFRASIRASVYNDRTAKKMCNLVRDAIAEYKTGEN